MQNNQLTTIIQQNNSDWNRLEHKNYSFTVEVITNQEGHLDLGEEYITLIANQGSYELTLGEKHLKQLECNLLLLKKGDHLRYKKIEESSTLYVLHLHPDFFDTYMISQMADCPILYDFLRLNATQMEYLFFDISSSLVCERYLELLFYEASSGILQDDKTVKCAAILFLTNLHHVHQECLIISESSMMEDYDIGRYLKYMAENYATVTLNDMAKQFNFHPAYFSARFKKMANSSFSEKLLLIKLEQAKRLLVTTNLSVYQIVEMIGFKEKSYFYKVFRKFNNKTPLEYREESRKR